MVKDRRRSLVSYIRTAARLLAYSTQQTVVSPSHLTVSEQCGRCERCGVVDPCTIMDPETTTRIVVVQSPVWCVEI